MISKAVLAFLGSSEQLHLVISEKEIKKFIEVFETAT